MVNHDPQQIVLRIDEVVEDDQFKIRAKANASAIEQYVLTLRDDGELPPVTVIEHDDQYLLVDGYHRLAAYRKVGTKSIKAELFDGTHREAILHAIEANAQHGVRLTRNDKCLLIKRFFADDEWSGWSNNRIARICHVSDKTVAKVRREIFGNSEVTTRRVMRNGQEYEVETANIGGNGEAEPHDDYILLDDYEKDPDQPITLAELERENQGRQLNTTQGNIDWAQWSWNPVTGCRHGCPYCYARDHANRFYGERGFNPCFYPDRLAAPGNTRVPRDAAQHPGKGRVFTGSMTDLFGKWVPQRWIDAVLEVIRANPQWTFLTLTKFPERLAEQDWPANAWVGATVDCQARVERTEKAFEKIEATVKWLSIEPLRERLTFNQPELFNWIAIGAQTQPDVQPKWEWVESLTTQFRAAGTAIYYKDNLTIRPKETPTFDVPETVGDEA